MIFIFIFMYFICLKTQTTAYMLIAETTTPEYLFETKSNDFNDQEMSYNK